MIKGKREPYRRFSSEFIESGRLEDMVNSGKSKSVDEQTDLYLSERRKRKLEEAKDADLDLAAEQSKTEAARQRKERELIEGGKISPRKGEEVNVENGVEKLEEAAAVAAEAAAAGVDPGKAADLATGKSRVVIVEKVAEGTKPVEEVLRERAEVIEQAKALYGSCIDAGGDPKQCANMVAGLIPSAAGPSSPPATSITELIQALKTLDELRGANTGLTELKASFDNLAAKIVPGNVGQPLDPVAFAKQQAEALKEWKKVIEEITPSPSATGEPLEVVKEKNRHNEKMEEIKADKDYKETITEIASDIPERIGKGIAGRVGEGGKGSGGGGGGLPYMICTEKNCGTRINFTPESKTITCPKCGTVYERGKESETEQ